ncbi:MAG TPA: cation:proton antiporter, partial [Flavisolibacter sp.]
LPTTPSIDIVLTLVTPYCMYYAAEHFHFSGVLAVVSGGLFLSGKRQSMLNYRSRIEGINVWTSLVFVLNGLIFLLIGLQLPTISQQLGDVSLSTAIGYGLAISLLLIITRLACTFGAALFTRVASNFITVADANPGWKLPFIAGWAGMRGVVSLAAALSIPVTIGEGAPFPYRNLILFITFVVILFTLVFQGLTLPWLIKKVKLEDKNQLVPVDEQEIIIQKKLALRSLELLQEKYGSVYDQNPHLKLLFSRFQTEIDFHSKDTADGGTNRDTLKSYQDIYLDLLEQQRVFLLQINRQSEFDEELIRKYLALIDLEELKLRGRFETEL